jgi:flagellar basal-body rod protein FlgC
MSNPTGLRRDDGHDQRVTPDVRAPFASWSFVFFPSAVSLMDGELRGDNAPYSTDIAFMDGRVGSPAEKAERCMNSILSIAISGMQAAATRLQVSANNVANALSAGALPDAQGNYPDGAPRAYVPQRVDQVDVSGGGTRAIVSDVSPSHVPTYDPGAPYANADGQVASPNVDLTQEAIQQLVASYAYAANARVVTSYDQMVKSLLDMKA